MRQPGPLLVGLYAWTVTVMLGAVLIDVVWASQMSTDAPEVAAEVRDFLLVLAAMPAVTAIGAIAVSGDHKPAGYPLVASFVLVVFAVLAPVFLSGIIGEVDRALGVRVGPWLRIGDAGLASILAFVGLRASWRNT
jgi:hypothetical protein